METTWPRGADEVECPTCGAPQGAECTGLPHVTLQRAVTTGEYLHLTHPERHPERAALVEPALTVECRVRGCDAPIGHPCADEIPVHPHQLRTEDAQAVAEGREPDEEISLGKWGIWDVWRRGDTILAEAPQMDCWDWPDYRDALKPTSPQHDPEQPWMWIWPASKADQVRSILEEVNRRHYEEYDQLRANQIVTWLRTLTENQVITEDEARAALSGGRETLHALMYRIHPQHRNVSVYEAYHLDEHVERARTLYDA